MMRCVADHSRARSSAQLTRSRWCVLCALSLLSSDESRSDGHHAAVIAQISPPSLNDDVCAQGRVVADTILHSAPVEALKSVVGASAEFIGHMARK